MKRIPPTWAHRRIAAEVVHLQNLSRALRVAEPGAIYLSRALKEFPALLHPPPQSFFRQRR